MFSSLKSSIFYIPSKIFSYFTAETTERTEPPLTKDFQLFIRTSFQIPIGHGKLHSLENSHFTNKYELQEKIEENNNAGTEEQIEDYKVSQGETLFGIACQFNLALQELLQINHLSIDYAFPGQVLMIPKKNYQIFLESQNQKDQELNKNENEENLQKQIVENTIVQQPESIIKREFYYCTNYGEIRGLLTINSALLMFDPAISFQNKEKIQDQRIIKFQACVDLNDISDVQIVTLPAKITNEFQQQEGEKEQAKDYFLQILLLTIGNKQIEKKFGERIIQMKKEKNAMATLFFKIYEKNDQEQVMSNYNKLEKIKFVYSQLTKFYQNSKKKFETEENISSTNVPFFDILYENILKSQTLRKMSSEEQLKLSSPSSSKKEKGIYKALPNFIPKLNNESRILDQKKVLKYIPPFFKLRNWSLAYSNMAHGHSMNTLQYKCESIGPNVLVVKDFENNIFGGFCSEPWHISPFFYGNGESFLFKFEKKVETLKFKVFLWTGLNKDIQFMNEDGFSIGAGDRFGIFISSDIMKGSTHKCDTFNNDVLSTENDFQIQDIEVDFFVFNTFHQIWSLSDGI